MSRQVARHRLTLSEVQVTRITPPENLRQAMDNINARGAIRKPPRPKQ